MQFSALILHADWPVLIGAALIAAGIVLAAQTLGLGGPRPGVAHILRAYRPAEWSRRQSAHERTRPMDQAIQWQRVAAIAQSGVARAEAVADLQARATHELEAVDDALIRLLADFTPDAMLSIRQREVEPDSAEIAEPLAA
jgi:hypothetical protein